MPTHAKLSTRDATLFATVPCPKRPAGRKDRKQEISWFKNPEWTEALVAILVDDEGTRVAFGGMVCMLYGVSIQISVLRECRIQSLQSKRTYCNHCVRGAG